MVDVLIIGGGLAGLVNAVQLSRVGLKIMVIEKNEFPKHKVCGEYISNEVLPYLQSLGVDPYDFGATAIKDFQLSTSTGKITHTQLPLGGFGISRYTLDNALYNKTISNGGVVKKATVEQVSFLEDHFQVTTREGMNYTAKFVIGAYGKRSNLDVKLDRDFIKQKAPYLAVKAHYQGEFPNDLVALHNFEGGYCGVSKVENDFINICYLTDFEAFKKYKNLETFQQEVVCKNPRLKEIFTQVTPAWKQPLTISQISFLPKKTMEQHIMMSGDTAGMIHPLCGNGMGMAIHSAKLLADLLEEFFSNPSLNRQALESQYIEQWERTFRKRLYAGRFFNVFLTNKRLFEITMSGLSIFPKSLPFFIKQTHGSAIAV